MTTLSSPSQKNLAGAVNLPLRNSLLNRLLQRMSQSDQNDNLPSLPSDSPLDDRARQLVLLARAVLSEHLDAAAIGRIVQATQEIFLSLDRIQTESLAIGSRLAQIDTILVGKFEAACGNPQLARRQATGLLTTYCQRVLRMSRSYIFLHMQIYRRFLDNNKALNLFSISELSVLVRASVSDDDLLMVMEEKEKNNKIGRQEIRQLLRKSRETDEQLLEAEAKLEGARDELAQAVSTQRDMEYEIKQLRAQAQQTAAERDTHRAALSDAQVDLARSNSSVSKFQMAIDDLTHERDRLLEQLATAKARVETKEVLREVPPAGYVTIEAAIEDVNQRLAAAQRELKDTLTEMEAAHNAATSEANTHAILTDFHAHFEAMVTKFSLAQLRVLMESNSAKVRPLLETMAAVVGRYHSDLVAAIAVSR
ncbi:hypothetical protein [Cupriavidus necator]|uniref:hypothetical protein n=1 Tax=Cupriavidus necator TaxID=106590 RepID=UPI00129D39EB|nr:hypothetical protein [Cupriavidus necator]